jgi:hypothetical protein
MAAIRHARTGRWVQDGQSASTLQTSGDLHLTSIAFLNGVARSNSRTSTAYAAVQMLCRCYISAAAENTTAARECTVNNSYCINSNCSAEVPRNTQFPGCCWVINILADTTRFKRLELSMSFADYDRDLNVYMRPSHTARVITECKNCKLCAMDFAIGSENGLYQCAHAFVHALWCAQSDTMVAADSAPDAAVCRPCGVGAFNQFGDKVQSMDWDASRMPWCCPFCLGRKISHHGRPGSVWVRAAVSTSGGSVYSSDDRDDDSGLEDSSLRHTNFEKCSAGFPGCSWVVPLPCGYGRDLNVYIHAQGAENSDNGTRLRSAADCVYSLYREPAMHLSTRGAAASAWSDASIPAGTEASLQRGRCCATRCDSAECSAPCCARPRCFEDALPVGSCCQYSTVFNADGRKPSSCRPRRANPRIPPAL